ncbi:MAG: RNA polymerase subunit sigma-70 [Clostridiales bacterium]|nr:MAG: RNA polymerase subunit sigma-70 [Clostridiales bacterium]
MFWMLSNILFLFLKLSGNANFPPPLSKEQERDYFEKCKNGDTDARNILIERNLRLVAHIAKKYYSSGYDNDDLISIGTIGLIKAIDSFNPASGTRFATYAGKCLQNEILMYFRSQKKQALESSLNDAVETDKDGNPLTYMDIISTDDDIAEQIDLKIKIEKMMNGINNLLTPTEKQIIVLRYGLGCTKPITQREVAQKLKISRSYVSRLESKAISKLKDAFGNEAE